MRVCLFEDSGVRTLEPLSLTRPVFELLCGCSSLASKQSRYFPVGPRGALIRPALEDLWRLRVPEVAVNDLAWLRGAPTLLVNGRWLPPATPLPLHDLDAPFVALVGEEVAYALLTPEYLAGCSAANLESCLNTWKIDLPSRPAGGRLFRYLWELVEHNGEQIRADWRSAARRAESAAVPVAIVGPPEQLYVHPSARLDPLVAVDTTRGPVIVEREAVVTSFTRLEGPCYVGPSTQLQGAHLRAGTTLGPQCRIGGEVEASIVQGYSNKAHDGFLGHSYLGEWVNLGAGAQVSDLRNDYGSVRVMVDGRMTATGLTKVGCFLGDHTKVGLGSLLNTGTSAGIFCGLLPGSGLLPRYIPSFLRHEEGCLLDHADVHALLHTAAEVMRRRNVVFTEMHAELYSWLFDQTAAQRRQVVRDFELQRLRRSAG